MAGVKRLLLVIKKLVKAELIDEYGFTSFVTGKPIPITPLAWEPESGLSHYGYVLDGLKLKDLDKLEQFQKGYTGVTVHEFYKTLDKLGKSTKTLETVEQTLARVGLGINELALEDEPAKIEQKASK